MNPPPSPGALNEQWRDLVARIKAGEPALGERLYLLGAGPVPVSGAVGGALTLTRDGGVVLVVGLGEASASSATEVARQLEGIERLPGAKLREAGVDPGAGGGLGQRHATYFGLSAPVAELNTSQRCVVVLAEDASGAGTTAFRDEIGDRLHGVFAATAAGIAPLAAPPEAEIELEPEPEAPEPEAEAAEAEAEPEAEAQPEIEPEPEVPEAEAQPATPDAEAEASRAEAPEAETGAEAEAPEAEGPASIEVALDDAPAPEADEAPADGDTSEDTSVGDAAAAVVEAATGQPAEVFDAYLADESTTVITEESDLADEKTGIAAWPIGNWVGLTLMVFGIALLAFGISMWRTADDGPAEEPAGKPNPLIVTVADGVPPDATHGRWIGQQRVAQLNDGTLAFVYATTESLNVVKDEADGGETWGEPFALTEVQPVSLSVDVDSKDRLHVAYSDGASINYVRLKNKPAGWKPSRVIQLDDHTTSLNVDVAWDEQNQTAHVVWVQQSDDGEAPAWAALTNEGGIDLTEEGILAQPGTDVPVLASIAADGRSSLLITYRRGDQTTGWSSRYASGRSTDGTWLFNEEEAVPLASFVGAADVVYDRHRTAHLILRDSTNFALTYFSKSQNEAWTQAEVAQEGLEVTQVEFPVLSTNAADKSVYLFFQTDVQWPAGEIHYVVRTPDGLWDGPFDVLSEADAPEGAQYPATLDRVDEQALVFWTKTGETYEVGTAPVPGPSAPER